MIGVGKMSKPTLGQIVNLCLDQKMNLIRVVENHNPVLIDTKDVLNRYPDVEVVAMIPELHSGVNHDLSISYLNIFRVFI